MHMVLEIAFIIRCCVASVEFNAAIDDFAKKRLLKKRTNIKFVIEARVVESTFFVRGLSRGTYTLNIC